MRRRKLARARGGQLARLPRPGPARRRQTPAGGDRPDLSPEASALLDELLHYGGPRYRVGIVTAALGTIIGAVSAVATTSLLLLPNLGASTENRAEIRRLAIESDVTLDEYFKHRSVARSLAELRKALPKQTGLLMDREQSRLQTHGTVIHFEVELKGLRGVEIRPRWSLFDGDTGKRLASSDEVRDPLPLALKIEKKDADTGTWEMWVDTSGLTATNFMVRLELYDERNGARVTFKDSEKFRAPPA